MGNSSPRKKGVGIGELGMDGGASYRTENGMRRTKRFVSRVDHRRKPSCLRRKGSVSMKHLGQSARSWLQHVAPQRPG